MHQHRTAIMWFRQDLRLNDNEALFEALNSADFVLPVYVFDPRNFEKTTHFNFDKTSSHRTQFIIESVENLRHNLRNIGADLIIRIGKPEEELTKLAKEIKSSWVFCNRERTEEEVFVQDGLEKNLWSIGQEIRYSRGKMLFYTQDLPFPITHTPDVFTQFRKEVEKFVPIRKPLPFPDLDFPMYPKHVEEGEMPSVENFGLEKVEGDKRSAVDWKGGESAALQHLNEYIHIGKHIETYKKTRNSLIGKHFSSKFSAWLSQGALSPKVIYWEIKKFEETHGVNDSTYHMVFELLWRDFFRLMGKKHGNNIFKYKGTKNQPETIKGKEDFDLLKLWIQGRTGVPFIDANMRELAATGFMSNRGRQNVASFLVHELGLNWQMGAEYFESQLVDYDPCSNYGNWNYLAGVGADPRENRKFNILNQALKYDADTCYVKTWLPELAHLEASQIHRIDLVEDTDQLKFGVHYPRPIIKFNHWL